VSSIKVVLIGAVILYLLIGAVIYFFQDRLIFLPEKLPQDFKFEFDHAFEEFFLTTQNGGKINVLHFKSLDSKGIIVYFHGNAGSLKRWGEIVGPLVDLGYDIVIPDYRGYGKSTGERNQKNMLTDVEAVYAFAKKITSEDQIVLFGRSLGSGFASYLAGKNNPSKLILETPFYSLDDIAQRRFLIFPTRWFLKYHFDSYKYLQSAKAPIYIFHGTDDEVVAYESGKKLFISLPENQGKLFTIKGGQHNNLPSFDRYWEQMKMALTK